MAFSELQVNWLEKKNNSDRTVIVVVALKIGVLTPHHLVVVVFFRQGGGFIWSFRGGTQEKQGRELIFPRSAPKVSGFSSSLCFSISCIVFLLFFVSVFYFLDADGDVSRD